MASIAHAASVVMPNRPHDYLYDYNYTVSSRKDHAKQFFKSQAQQVVINPHYENMFSALRHFPPTGYSFKSHSLPPGIGQDRRIPYDPVQVSGAHRFKFFRRPIMPYMPSLGGQIVYARKAVAMVKPAMERAATPVSKTVGVQTIFRESEAQTDPYSPEYILRPNLPPPELLALATLTYGAGLPAGVAELEMIERARYKRAWEATLPSVNDVDSFEIRLKMMEEMELKEWKEREDEIKRLQEARLRVLVKVIEQREQENESANDERIERIWQRKLQERDALFEKTNRKRIKAMRKLTEKRNKVENKIERRDVIAEYANYGSKVYGPPARDGVFRDKSANPLAVELDDLSTYRGLTNLEKTLKPNVFNAKVELHSDRDRAGSPNARKEKHLLEELEIMSKKLREQKNKNEFNRQDEEPITFAVKIEKPPQRPPTPSVNVPREEDEEMEIAALLLQKLVRGRIVQDRMFEGKERRLQLINELRNRHEIRKATESAKSTDDLRADSAVPLPLESEIKGITIAGHVKYTPESKKKPKTSPQLDEQDLATDLMAPVELLFESGVESEYVGKTLDYLTKELVRLREERRIAAMVRLAERTRRMREAEESGRRQVEIKRRAQEDEIFKQIMNVHKETVDSFLEDIVVGSVSHTASEQAREQVREYARKMDVVTQHIADTHPENSDEMTVTDLVSSFLIPHVEKEMTRHQVQQDQQKYLVAAHRSLYGPVLELEKLNLDENDKKESSSS